MKNKQLITVIMPTYNRANLIEQSIKSVLNQTYTNFEFFILDDGSTDNTKEVVTPYLNDNRIKYLYHENQGEAETVNWGWSLANGEYFTQVNSDDTITPDSFEIMVKYMDKNPEAVIAYPDFNFIDKNNNITFVTKSPDWNFIDALSSFTCYAASAGTFIRKSAFKDWEKIKRTRFKHINDVEMYWDMALVGNFIHVPHVLANWRVHSDQISANRYQSIPEIEEWFEYYFSKDNLPQNVKNIKANVRKSILNYFISLIKNSNLSGKEKRNLSKKYLNELGIDNLGFNCLQIGDNDLIGNKFNGHDLHIYLREKGIKCNHIVNWKQSKDRDTFPYIRTNDSHIFMDNLIRSELFLEADILHLHLIHNTAFDINYLPLITSLKPTILHLHDPYFLDGHCIYHFDCEKWKTMCQDCEYLEKPFKRKDDTSAFEFLEKKKAIQNSNIVAIVASKWMENKVKQSPIWKDKQIYRLPFGINQEIFKPSDKNIIKKELKIPNDAIVLMFRSDDSPYKGSNIIKDALKKLKTNKKIVILTVAQKGNLKEFRDKFDIREYGWLNNDEILAQLYQASDLFLMPSSQEAFGMMAIEAMSCAVPVLSIKNTSLEDVTNAPECGICVEKEEYAFELQRLIDNCSEIKERGKKSLDFARNNYNKDIYIDKLIKIYQYTIDSFDIDNDAKVVLEQLNRYAKTNEMNIKKPYAYNKLWRLLYKLTYRIYLKKKYGKERVKNIFDKKYL